MIFNFGICTVFLVTKFHWRSHIGANDATAPLEIAKVEFSKFLYPLSFHFFVNEGGNKVLPKHHEYIHS